MCDLAYKLNRLCISNDLTIIIRNVIYLHAAASHNLVNHRSGTNLILASVHSVKVSQQ